MLPGNKVAGEYDPRKGEEAKWLGPWLTPVLCQNGQRATLKEMSWCAIYPKIRRRNLPDKNKDTWKQNQPLEVKCTHTLDKINGRWNNAGPTFTNLKTRQRNHLEWNGVESLQNQSEAEQQWWRGRADCSLPRGAQESPHWLTQEGERSGRERPSLCAWKCRVLLRSWPWATQRHHQLHTC